MGEDTTAVIETPAPVIEPEPAPVEVIKPEPVWLPRGCYVIDGEATILAGPFSCVDDALRAGHPEQGVLVIDQPGRFLARNFAWGE